jgi:hypothetical protein
MNPRSIDICLLDGDPNGIRAAQIMRSTIQVIGNRCLLPTLPAPS